MILRITAEELMPRPRQRMKIQHNRCLTSRLGIRKHGVQRNPGTIKLKEIHRR
jgi:hypothetical protein